MKKFLAIFLVCVTLFTLCACSDTFITGGDTDGKTGGDEQPEEVFKTEEEIESYFDNILVSYKYTTSESEEEIAWTVAQNDKAIFINILGLEMLYMKGTGEQYMFSDGQKILYAKDSEMNFSDYTGLFVDYSYNTEDFTRTGTKTIAGRTCTVYENSAAAYGMYYSVKYSIDNETGICMEVAVSGSAEGESGFITWIVTEIQIGGVNLDQYINQPTDLDYTTYDD